MREVAAPHVIRSRRELVNGAGDRTRERQPHAEGHRLDDQKERGDHHQQDDQQLPDAVVADLRQGRRGNAPVDVGHVETDGDDHVAHAAGGPVHVIEERHPGQRLAGARRRRILFNRAARDGHDVSRGHAERRDVAELDAGLVLNLQAGGRRDGNVHDDGVARDGLRGQRDGAHGEVRSPQRVLANGGATHRRRLIRDQSRVSIAHHPAWKRPRRVEMRPRATRERPVHGASRRRVRGPAHPRRRHDDDGRAVVPRGCGFLPPGQHLVEGRIIGRPRELDRGGLGKETRLVHERVDARLHQVRADVEEQQQAAQEKEDDDQQDREEPDEDVGQRQLAAHAPQKAHG